MTSEKLDILMKITDTKNSALGRALSFDPSYIGRIRSGKRGIPKHMPFVEPASTYFAKNIKTDYQKKLVSEIVNGGKPIPEEKNALKSILSAWLNDENKSKSSIDSIDFFLQKLSSVDTITNQSDNFSLNFNYTNESLANTVPTFFYGNEGKRKVTEIFLNRLCSDCKPHTLFLFSDEDMTWLYEDQIFAKKWAAYLIKLLSTGSHIKIIHSINRNLNDLMEAIQNWLPLYVSGNIEPYYYPRLRDGIYHRTLFIAVDQFAIVSDSIGNDTSGMPNLFLKDHEVINGLEKEFNNFLSLCVPLMKIYRYEDKKNITSAIYRFKNTKNEIYFVDTTNDNADDIKTEYTNDIINLTDEHTNIIEINSTKKNIPDNMFIITGINTGVLVFTDKLIFDTTEPSFTMTFMEYLSKI